MSLGDEFPNQAALRDEVRRRLGLGAVALPDAAADALIAEAFRHFLRRRPGVYAGTFEAAANTAAYDPLPVGAYRIRRVYWPAATCGDGVQILDRLIAVIEPSLATVPVNVEGLLVQGRAEPAPLFALLRQERWLSRMLGSTAKVLNGTRVYLVPPPTSAGVTVPFLYSAPRYDTVFEIEEIEAFFAAVLWRWLHGQTAGAAGAGDITLLRDPITGVEARRGSLADRQRAANAARREFYEMLPGGIPSPGTFP